MISETKFDATFPTNLFFIQEYSNVYRLDRNDKSGGIMVFSFGSIFLPCRLGGILNSVEPSKEKRVYLLYL